MSLSCSCDTCARVHTHTHVRTHNTNRHTCLRTRTYPCHVCLQHVRLDFDSFTLQACGNCSCDKMNIYDGRDATAPLIQTLCGSDLPGAVESSGNQLFVHFESDGTSITRGFRIKYSAVGKTYFYWIEINSKGAVHSLAERMIINLNI